ncbi:MAG: T9SS type A sorting domain-containing protein [Bacteroidales bacterium]
MKKCYFIVLFSLMLMSGFLQAQSKYLKKISAYDNNYSNSSGIIAISDTAVYEYSWYYETWLPFPDSGLTKHNGVPVVNDVTAFDNDSDNPSGIYVISDTAVFVYNYWTEKWHNLENEGLIRDEGVVQLSSVSAHKDTDTGNTDIHVVSDTAVFRYDWYNQLWNYFPNDGLTSKLPGNEAENDTEISNFPNPFTTKTNITYKLPKHYDGKIRIALFDQKGKLVREILNENQTGGRHTVELNADNLDPGVYYYEICGEQFSQARKAVCVK